MNPIDTTVPSQYESLTFEFELLHPPPKVWRALTEPELLAEWLLPAVDFELRQGAAFSFITQPQPGWDGIVDGLMLEIEPQRKLSWKWIAGDIDTVVTFMLTPTASGTHLRILHSGFKPAQKKNFGGARYGWKMMGEKLINLLATTS
jgi:uncharacterized protein YndB with AHSA1/START domain